MTRPAGRTGAAVGWILLVSACHTLPAISPRDAGSDKTTDVGTDVVTDVGTDTTPDAGCLAGQLETNMGCRDEPKSCVRLKAADGGDSGSCAGQSCCAHSWLPPKAGFYRGWDNAGSPTGVIGFVSPSMAAAQVNVAGFFLDHFEVTVGRFRTFLADYAPGPPALADKKGAHPSDLEVVSGWDRSWDNANTLSSGALWARSVDELYANIKANCGTLGTEIVNSLTTPSPATDRRPMTCVSWFEAFMFCLWDDARDATSRLPIETEWNYAAVGGEKYLPFPWDDPSGSPGSLDAQALAHANVSATRGTTTIDLDDVGSHPNGVSIFGPHDLAGNAYEMVRDWVTTLALSTGAPPISAGRGIELDPTYQYVLRGGSYFFEPIRARAVFRERTQTPFPDIGWRCARDQKP